MSEFRIEMDRSVRPGMRQIMRSQQSCKNEVTYPSHLVDLWKEVSIRSFRALIIYAARRVWSLEGERHDCGLLDGSNGYATHPQTGPRRWCQESGSDSCFGCKMRFCDLVSSLGLPFPLVYVPRREFESSIGYRRPLWLSTNPTGLASDWL